MEEKSQQTKKRVEILTINLVRWDRAQQIEKAAAKPFYTFSRHSLKKCGNFSYVS